jgi:hypothetical protein
MGPGRFVVPQVPESLWDRYSPSTLRCAYSGSKYTVVVWLPRRIRVCDFTVGPQVACH